MKKGIKFFIFTLILSQISLNSSEKSHGISIFGPKTLKYKEGEPFEYLNPDAPITGTLKMACGAFTKISPFGLKGSTPPIHYALFDTLGTKSWDDDEPYAVYGILAEYFEIADDKKSMKIYLRKEAKFSDGKPVTADDVVFSYNLLYDPYVSPAKRLAWKNVSKVVKLDKHTVRFDFKKYTRDLPITVSYLVVYPKHIYGEPGKSLKDFDKMIPVGSGPYTVESYTLGEQIVYKRRKDYWAKNVPYCKGFFNWERIECQTYYDNFAKLEALKSGFIHFDACDFDTYEKLKGNYFDKGYIIKHNFPITRPSAMICYDFNMRRPLFQDVKLRKIITSLYDFDYYNKNYKYGYALRLVSYFHRQKQLRASSKPAEGKVKEILQNLQKKYNKPEEGKIYVPDDAIESGIFELGTDRDGKRIPIEERVMAANIYLDEMGWKWDPELGVRRKGKQKLEFEILCSWDLDTFHFTETLAMAGIRAKNTRLSRLESQSRIKNFNYDLIHNWIDARQAPGREFAKKFLSSEADIRGSRNKYGLKNPAVDELLNKVSISENREEVNIYAKALDRILISQCYCVPRTWPKYSCGVYWAYLQSPEKYCSGLWYYYNVLWFWWHDEEKYQELQKAMKAGVPLKIKKPKIKK